MKNGLFELKSDTWAIIGAGAAMAAIMMTVMLALNAATNARISEQGERLDARIDAQDARLDMLYDTMRNEHALILESLAGVAQRVSYIEGHLGIGRAADPEPDGPPQG
ncbi:MAG: hypothetical protein OXI73_08785 [Rhodospirillales bacterium]|nr:hypothetical protein [Rhodospirillales bacterium]